MSISKKEAIDDLKKSRGLSNQEALVKKIISNNVVKVTKRYIPGGKNLLSEVTKETITDAVYTWLRHCRNFTECTISLTEPLDLNTLKQTKTADFNPNGRNSEWETRGKKWLAEKVGKALLMNKTVAVVVKRDGIFCYSSTEELNDEDDNWMPYIEFTPFRPGVFD